MYDEEYSLLPSGCCAALARFADLIARAEAGRLPELAGVRIEPHIEIVDANRAVRAFASELRSGASGHPAGLWLADRAERRLAQIAAALMNHEHGAIL